MLESRGGVLASTRNQYPLVLPYALIDERIFDLALKLDCDADSALMTAFRRLEGIVSTRCGLNGVPGNRIFTTAFVGRESLLVWDSADEEESQGRANLFTGSYKAFRNPRAHKELVSDRRRALREFLLVNELFLLEAEAVRRTGS